MRDFLHYLKDYFRNIPLRNFLFTFVFVAGLITLNYTLGIENRIRALSPWPLSFSLFFGLYLGVFGIAYSLQTALPGFPPRPGHGFLRILSERPDKGSFAALLLLAPLLFALKMVHWDLSWITGSGPVPGEAASWRRYWLLILQLPVKLLVILGLLYACWRLGRKTGGGGEGTDYPDGNDSFYGLTAKGFSALPYFKILLLLLPLVAIASTQHDFLQTYPRMKNMAFLSERVHPAWPWQLLYELSYGLDFVSIELFFRGFLVLGFVRFAGIHAILPMAAFYCTIHFGKPLGECISSFFGGLALGVIAWRSRTILGGLIVHLGLAWMMELGGWLGNNLVSSSH
ncbi:MAG: hypothetical protein P4L51_13790 [Puia sp.]|nr:hypothetical protein [Puia sp.]